METVARIFEHFGRSETRLDGNAEKARVITAEITALEELADRLRELTGRFQGGFATRAGQKPEKPAAAP